MTKLDYPFDYTDLEPAAEVAKDDAGRATADAQDEAFSYSQAISLKRIADALDKIEHHLAPITRGVNLLKPDGTPNSLLDITRKGE
jgi:hypothetical protein